MLHAKMTDLSHQLAFLKSKYPTLKTEKRAKDRIIEALDEVVLQLYLAANTALDSAMAKLASTHEVGEEVIDSLVQRIRGLSDEMDTLEDLDASLEEITVSGDARKLAGCSFYHRFLTLSLSQACSPLYFFSILQNLQELMVKRVSLERVLLEVVSLGKTITNLPPLPTTRMRVSDLLTKVSH